MAAVAIILATIFAYTSLAPSEDYYTKSYGPENNTVIYKADNIPDNEAEIVSKLKSAGLFTDGSSFQILAQKNGSEYTFSMFCNESVKNNKEVYAEMKNIREVVQSQFPKNKVRFNIVIDEPDNIIKSFDCNGPAS